MSVKTRYDSRNGERSIAGLFGYGDCTIEAAYSPYRGQEAENKGEPRRPPCQIGPTSECELRSVELRSTSYRQSNNGHQS